MTKSTKKTGVLIIAILFILAGIVLAIVGILCFIPSQSIAGTSIIGEIWQVYVINFPYIGSYFDKLTKYVIPYLMTLGGIAIVIGAIILLDGIGLFLYKKWAHSIAVLLSIIAIVVIIGIIFIWYLLKPEVKESFGKL
ncbi:MAG: hypothetical protein ACTSPY_05225 [Candidatus Helarchaeota archaeon]